MQDREHGYIAEAVTVQGRTLMRAANQAQGISACLSPADGAELCSLAVRDSVGKHELLYQGNDWRPVVGWSGRAPWLWPTAGRNYSAGLANGSPDPQSVFRWVDQGCVLPMPHHGFIRARSWQPGAMSATHNCAEVCARYQSAPGDQTAYPFAYYLESRVLVEGSTVVCRFDVRASQDNPRPMPFTIGQHLTFNLASWWDDSWLDGTLTGAGRTVWGVNELALAQDEKALATLKPRLSDKVLGDALIPTIPDRPLTLLSPDGRKGIDVSFDVTSLPSVDAAIWVTHRDPAGRFFCLEPWIGWPNGLCTGRGRIELLPGAVWSMSVQVHIMATGRGLLSADMSHPAREVHIEPGMKDVMSTRARRDVPKAEPLSEEV